MNIKRTAALLGLVGITGLLAAACGSDGEPEAQADAPAATEAPAVPEVTPAPPTTQPAPVETPAQLEAPEPETGGMENEHEEPAERPERPTEPAVLEVDLMVEAFSSVTCQDMQTDDIWWDLPYSQVNVRDGADSLLGFGELDSGFDTLNSCIFEDTFEVSIAEDGLYQVEVGDNGDSFAYDESDITDGTLEIEITFNDNDADGVPDDYVEPAPIAEPTSGAFDGFRTEVAYEAAKDLWLSLPSGTLLSGGDGCDDWLNPEVSVEDVAYATAITHPEIDPDAYIDALIDYC